MRLAALPLLVVLAGVAAAQDEGAGTTEPETTGAPASADAEPAPAAGTVLRLRIADVGRLALRNSPRFKVAELDPSIAETFEREARGEFDPLFAARFEGGRERTEVFFDPSRFGPGGGSEDSFLTEDTLSGGASVSSVEEWGGVWTLGVDATSADRSGAASIQTLAPRYSGLLSLGYTHPLLRGAGREARLSREREARSQTERSEELLVREAQRTVLEAETIYWSLVRAKSDRDVLVDSLRTANELLDISRARLDAGRGINADVVEAEAGVARREGELISVEADIGNLSDRLRELVMPFDRPGADLELVVEPADLPRTDVASVPADPDRDALEAALLRRPDMRAAAAALEAARQAEIRARNEDEVELNALLNGGVRGLGSGFSDSVDQMEDRDSYVWTAGLELEVPLGNETRAARLLRAERETLRAERGVAALRNEVVREIREAVRNVRSAARRIEAAVRERAATEAQLEAEEARLEKGRSRPFDVLEVEEDRSRAVARETAARVDLEIALAELSTATGTLLEERDITELAVGE